MKVLIPYTLRWQSSVCPEAGVWWTVCRGGCVFTAPCSLILLYNPARVRYLTLTGYSLVKYPTLATYRIVARYPTLLRYPTLVRYPTLTRYHSLTRYPTQARYTLVIYRSLIIDPTLVIYPTLAR